MKPSSLASQATAHSTEPWPLGLSLRPAKIVVGDVVLAFDAAAR